jgi:hypothetical protein
MTCPSAPLRSLAVRLVLGLAVLASLPVVSGCGRKQKAAVKEPRPVSLNFKIESKLEHLPKDKRFFVRDPLVNGATLLVDGREVGLIREAKDSVYVTAVLPEGKLLSDRSIQLGLRLPTPCGKAIDVPLPAYETNLESPEAERAAREELYPNVDIRRNAELPAPIPIWVDDVGHEGAKVEFGSVEVKGRVIPSDNAREAPGRYMILWGSDCAAAHEVKVDGVVVGKAAPLPDTRSYLIATEAEACYERKVARYASAHDSVGGGVSDFPIPRAQVMPLKWSGFDYFLRRLPSGVRGQFSSTRSSLERIGCDSAQKPASKPASNAKGARKK